MRHPGVTAWGRDGAMQEGQPVPAGTEPSLPRSGTWLQSWEGEDGAACRADVTGTKGTALP